MVGAEQPRRSSAQPRNDPVRLGVRDRLRAGGRAWPERATLAGLDAASRTTREVPGLRTLAHRSCARPRGGGPRRRTRPRGVPRHPLDPVRPDPAAASCRRLDRVGRQLRDHRGDGREVRRALPPPARQHPSLGRTDPSPRETRSVSAATPATAPSPTSTCRAWMRSTPNAPEPFPSASREGSRATGRSSRSPEREDPEDPEGTAPCRQDGVAVRVRFGRHRTSAEPSVRRQGRSSSIASRSPTVCPSSTGCRSRPSVSMV
jgi:hypothetical protein